MNRVGVGQLILRIYLFNEIQTRGPRSSNENETMPFWREFVHDFFHPLAIFRYILCKPNFDPHQRQKLEPKKMFQLGVESIPRLFHVIYSSGIQSLTHVMENPREYSIYNTKTYILISEKTKVLYLFENTNVAVLHGTLRITFDMELKILVWEFESQSFQEFFPRNYLGETNNNVNDYGIHQNIMRYLEIVEGINYMKELVNFSRSNNMNPIQSLRQYKHNNRMENRDQNNNNGNNRNRNRDDQLDENKRRRFNTEY